MTIFSIERMTEDQAKEMALESQNIKGYNVYFVDFDDGFGYSMLVFKSGHHIIYANDYQLHHSYMESRDDLRQWYLDTINHKLFTEEELLEPLKDYNEYEAKRNFLVNYYHMQKDYISGFYIGEEEGKRIKEQTKNMYYDPIGFCYLNDKDFIDHHNDLYKGLEKRKNEMKDNYEYYKKAFLHEMYNHEYGINWEADEDTLSAFGLTYADTRECATVDEYFDRLGFTDNQRRAYKDARKEYFLKEN